MKTTRAKVTKHKTVKVEEPTTKNGPGIVWQKDGNTIEVRMAFASPAQAWLPVTSKKTGTKVYLPLPIRLIQELPNENGKPSGCLVRGAHGDESTSIESASQIFAMLNAFPLGSYAEWALAE